MDEAEVASAAAPHGEDGSSCSIANLPGLCPTRPRVPAMFVPDRMYAWETRPGQGDEATRRPELVRYPESCAPGGIGCAIIGRETQVRVTPCALHSGLPLGFLPASRFYFSTLR